MSEAEEKKISDDATVEEAIHIVAEREINGEDAASLFLGRVTDIVHAQTIGAQE